MLEILGQICDVGVDGNLCGNKTEQIPASRKEINVAVIHKEFTSPPDLPYFPTQIQPTSV